ncbi:hypothetical protein Mlute_01911 [Meiothermus luteus]|jgi:hypothetical protein|uniref:Uncharacterized protein n=1 Tax=Meiothermus luteus TaxID=2026184 RepID=A0A399EK94_9DEIN|nr:hypothetical protein [Meiothermus luteus]RIH84378.1 hypothetical protein Mlute_01911 [Meiothermus luteus]
MEAPGWSWGSYRKLRVGLLEDSFLELFFQVVPQQLDAGGLAFGQQGALVEAQGLGQAVVLQGFLELQEVGLDGGTKPVGAVLDIETQLAQAAELAFEGLGVGHGVEGPGQGLAREAFGVGQQQGEEFQVSRPISRKCAFLLWPPEGLS